MKVSDILRVKGGGTLFTIDPMDPLLSAVATMAEKDMGSLLVMERGELVGLLTFREVIQALHRCGGVLGETNVRSAMDANPLTCSPDTELDDVRRMMLESHARRQQVLDVSLGGSVQTRRFGAVQFDQAVVNSHAGQGGQHMLDQGDLIRSVTQGRSSGSSRD